MNSPTYNLSEFFLGFLFLSGFYIVPVGLSFLLMKLIANKTKHSPYTLRAFLMICLPGLLYSLLESVASRQGLNFLLILPFLGLMGIVATILLRRLSLNIFVMVGCALALGLWLTVPKAVMRLM